MVKPENFKHLYRSVTTNWQEEVTIDTDFLNDEPRINIFVSDSLNQKAQAQITLKEALYIRDGINEMINIFKSEGY